MMVTRDMSTNGADVNATSIPRLGVERPVRAAATKPRWRISWLALVALVSACGGTIDKSAPIGVPIEVSPKLEQAPNRVQIEGFGRRVLLADHAYAAVLSNGNPANVNTVVVGMNTAGNVASALISPNGPAKDAASRPNGPIKAAGIDAIGIGPVGNWAIRYGGLRFEWSKEVLLWVAPDNHPGNLLPIRLAKNVETDEMVLCFLFEQAPKLDEFLAPGDKVVRSSDTPGSQHIELTYTHDTKAWRAWFYWVRTPAGVLVVKAQEIDGANVGLDAVARSIRDGFLNP